MRRQASLRSVRCGKVEGASANIRRRPPVIYGSFLPLSQPMTQTGTPLQGRGRADDRRTRDNLVATARDVFAAEGTSAPLEDVAERAGVGIGTLYRHFPNRRALLEAVYRDEVEAMARSADELAD